MSKAPSLALTGIGERISALDSPTYKLGELKKINLADIDVHPQVRRPISKDSIKGLASVIQREGQRQPIEVYYKDGRFVLVSGERRFRACQYLNKTVVEAKIVNEPDATQLVYLQLTENTETEPLSLVEVAIAVTRLFALGEKGATIAGNLNLGGRDVATKMKKIGEASDKVHALCFDHGINDQRTLYIAAQIEAGWPEVFAEKLYPEIANKTLARSELNEWLQYLKQLPVPEKSGSDTSSPSVLDKGSKKPEKASDSDLVGEGGGNQDSGLDDTASATDSEAQTLPSGQDGQVGNTEEASRKALPVTRAPSDQSGKQVPNGASNIEKIVKPNLPSPMERHTSQTFTKASPSSLCFTVRGKLPSGQTVNGTLLTDRVDEDSQWVWVMPDRADAEPLRFEAKKLKIVSLTSS